MHGGAALRDEVVASVKCVRGITNEMSSHAGANASRGAVERAQRVHRPRYGARQEIR